MSIEPQVSAHEDSMKFPNGSGVYRLTTVALLAALITGVGAWLTTSDTVTRNDVSAMITNESPYVEDRAVVSALGATVGKLTDAVNDLRVEMAELRAVMEVGR